LSKHHQILSQYLEQDTVDKAHSINVKCLVSWFFYFLNQDSFIGVLSIQNLLGWIKEHLMKSLKHSSVLVIASLNWRANFLADWSRRKIVSASTASCVHEWLTAFGS
jgi:hypothetical protein